MVQTSTHGRKQLAQLALCCTPMPKAPGSQDKGIQEIVLAHSLPMLCRGSSGQQTNQFVATVTHGGQTLRTEQIWS